MFSCSRKGSPPQHDGGCHSVSEFARWPRWAKALPILAAAAAFGAGSAGADDLSSVPFYSEPTPWEDEFSDSLPDSEAAPLEELSAPVIGPFTIGLNIEAARRGGANGPTTTNAVGPPDTMGSVGPNHIVLLINQNYRVLDKTTGAILENITLENFWANRIGLGAGNNRRFDPKIIYDPISERWFALSEDNTIDNPPGGVVEVANNIYIARTDTDDPTGDWDAVSFVADTVGAIGFHDYPQMGLDADGCESRMAVMSGGLVR